MVEKMCGSTIRIPETVSVFNSPNNFKDTDLDPLTLVKGSHGSGMVFNIKPLTTVAQVISELKRWNVIKDGIHPRFYTERKIEDTHASAMGEAYTYMVKCIYGKPFAIDVKYCGNCRSYTLDWKPLPLIISNVLKDDIAIPTQLNIMLTAAALLSSPFEFLRVDFYIGADVNVYFSEFDLCSNGGFMLYSVKQEQIFGKLWFRKI